MSFENSELFHDIYKEIAYELGPEIAIAIHNMYKGQQITFPTRLFHPARVKEAVKAQYNGNNMRELTQKYAYSEKTIRRMLKESIEE